jgi:[ribosomal protein S5]-alanine N-acetyltransferase
VPNALRVDLAVARPADRKEFLAAGRASVALHRGWVAPHRTMAEVEAFFAKGERDTACLLLARRRDDGTLAGWFMLSEIVRGGFQNAYLGYAAFRSAAGQGLMSEALALTLRHAFRTLGLHRVEANIQPHNAPSIALVRRAGFRLEGFSPRYLKVAGRWRDHERWAITRDEWRPAPR